MASHDSFDVDPFTLERLTGLLSEASKTPVAEVCEKDHLAYFEEYFDECDAKTIVLERCYIDHDYLDDYAAYYSKCFHAYDRFCSRLHFFTHSFSKDDFNAFLANEPTSLTSTLLQQSYLGFIVVKPLPDSFIGRTCLTTYPHDNRRFYPTTHRYTAHLYGTALTVQAVAFQEQDSTVAMCATSALWSAFHATGTLFQHSILSPVEITRAATLNSEDPMRFLPNTGLTQEQMARAIRAVSLEPYFVRVSDPHVLKSTIYAYLRGRIPLLLDIDLVDVATELDETSFPAVAPKPTNEANGATEGEASKHHLEGTVMGTHEVTVTGFSLGTLPSPFGPTGFLLRAARIDKLYAHDDQVGPYARMEIDEDGFLSTSWRGEVSGAVGTVKAAPGNLLVPLYNKIRIPFAVIHDGILVIDQLLEELRQQTKFGGDSRFEWDIFLQTANDLKEEISSNQQLPGVLRHSLLIEMMPRFLWRATAFAGSTAMLDLLFDATDIENGTIFLRAIEYDGTVGSVLRQAAKDQTVKKAYRQKAVSGVLEWFEAQS